MNKPKPPLSPAEADSHVATIAEHPEAVARFIRQAALRLFEHCPQAKGWMCDVHHVLQLNDSDSDTDAVTLPFLSIRAFRAQEIRQIPTQDVLTRFYSSGSTSGVASSRGMHCLGQAGSDAYAAAALRGYLGFIDRLNLSPASTTLVTMIPRLTEWKNSSLASMFELLASSGINVIWSSPESIIADISEQAGAHQPRNLIVFGTSLHHHIVHAARAAGSGATFPKENQNSAPWFDVVCVVDTGGAKGKTVVLDASEMDKLLRKTYSFIPCKERITASQYGMCELTSQAWSKSNLLREFVASPSLIPVVIDPQTMHRAAPGSAGLLAFIDCANVDSYPAIITEDLGIMADRTATDRNILRPGATFHLLGRAPMASIKGCSLRVQDLPVSQQSDIDTVDSPTSQTLSANVRAVLPLDGKQIEEHWLPVDSAGIPDTFTAREKELLRHAIESCPKMRDLSRNAGDQASNTIAAEKKLIIIASANVAITFLFPIIAALENGFTLVDLVLPSMRDDDPLALTISQQVGWILDGLNQRTTPYGMRIRSYKQLPENRQINSYHTLIVFGSNETVELFKSRYSNSPTTRVLGFGDVHNTIQLQSLKTSPTPEQLAARCLSWRGRGCLTPRLLVTKDTTLIENFLNEFREAFHTIFSQEFSCIAPDILALFHWHSSIEVRASFGSYVAIDRKIGSTIVDLRKVPSESLAKSLNLSLAGQGLILVITETQFSYLNQSGTHSFESVSIEPEFRDPHQGKSWSKWLGHQN
jgi:hypothetical protein